MDKIARFQQARGERVRDFADGHAALFASGDAAEDIAIVRAAVETLNTEGGEQSAHGQLSRGAVRRIAEVVREVEGEEQDIVRSFKRIKLRNPEITVTFEPPANRADDTIINTARGFITNAEPLKAKFIARGMDADFLDHLTDLVEEYDELTGQKTQHGEDKQDDTAAITAAVDRLVNTIEDLDDIMENTLKKTPAVLGEWKRASARGKIPRNPRQKKTP